MSILSGLNPQQLQAIESCDRHLLVVAGAGSGKTRVLTHKIAYLIEHVGVRPDQILAMTFSNKAANEMKERIAKLLPAYGQPRAIGTFHSVCLRILKEFHDRLGLAKDFSIYDDSDQISVLKRALETLGIDPKKFSPKLIRQQIDRAKNESMDVLAYLENDISVGERTLEIAALYQKTLQANQAMDFGDLLSRTVRLLQENPDVAETLRNRWKRLLIDEYQDTNTIQKLLVQTLAGPQGIVCAVGDEDQSIYAWRGARVENMMTFPEDFPGADIIKLEQNYRSTKRILSAANHVIQNNTGRRSKNLWTENPEGDMIVFSQAEDDYGEARTVLSKIERLLQSHGANAADIAIFYRTHAQSRLIEEECRRRNLPYKVLGGTKFFDRMEIKDILSYLQLAVNPRDNVAFLRVVNTPARGIGKQTLEDLATRAGEKELCLFDAIQGLVMNKKGDRALVEFHRWFGEFRSSFDGKSLVEIAEDLLKKSGYLKALEQENTIEAESRIENIQELLRSMDEFYQETQGTLADYMDRISLVSDTDNLEQGATPIVMMTVHNSKGLEFDHVFIVGMEENIFPHSRAIEFFSRDELEEERRLCYVAMTRAKKRLALTAAARRQLYKGVQFNPVSRFIEEIPREFILHEEDSTPPAFFERTPKGSSWKKKAVEIDEYRQESYDDLGDSMYSPGTQVMHPEFGKGTIKKCEGNADNLKVTVFFERRGVKKLALNYCTLEVVSR